MGFKWPKLKSPFRLMITNECKTSLWVNCWGELLLQWIHMLYIWGPHYFNLKVEVIFPPLCVIGSRSWHFFLSAPLVLTGFDSHVSPVTHRPVAGAAAGTQNELTWILLARLHSVQRWSALTSLIIIWYESLQPRTPSSQRCRSSETFEGVWFSEWLHFI